MKKAKLFLTAIMSLFLVVGINAQRGIHTVVHYHGPEKKIEKKIKKGIRSGKLTKKEVKDLKRELRYIDKIKSRAWRDGHLNRWERKKINKASHDFDRLLNKYLHNHKHRKNRHYDDWYQDDWRYNDNDYDYYYKNKNKKKRRH